MLCHARSFGKSDLESCLPVSGLRGDGEGVHGASISCRAAVRPTYAIEDRVVGAQPALVHTELEDHSHKGVQDGFTHVGERRKRLQVPFGTEGDAEVCDEGVGEHVKLGRVASTFLRALGGRSRHHVDAGAASDHRRQRVKRVKQIVVHDLRSSPRPQDRLHLAILFPWLDACRAICRSSWLLAEHHCDLLLEVGWVNIASHVQAHVCRIVVALVESPKIFRAEVFHLVLLADRKPQRQDSIVVIELVKLHCRSLGDAVSILQLRKDGASFFVNVLLLEKRFEPHLIQQLEHKLGVIVCWHVKPFDLRDFLVSSKVVFRKVFSRSGTDPGVAEQPSRRVHGLCSAFDGGRERVNRASEVGERIRISIVRHAETSEQFLHRFLGFESFSPQEQTMLHEMRDPLLVIFFVHAAGMNLQVDIEPSSWFLVGKDAISQPVRKNPVAQLLMHGKELWWFCLQILRRGLRRDCWFHLRAPSRQTPCLSTIRWPQYTSHIHRVGAMKRILEPEFLVHLQRR
mmetsp:Transcript_6645/g.15237  ORF Transcript_6645/g.15237 Transcript_6645/m.15237 type:complete len:514 (-) Transcript_6645:292-1833(-)